MTALPTEWFHPQASIMEQSSGYAVGWFTLALVNSGLAQGKGRSGLGWWLGSLFLGPIATFFIVISPNRLR